MGTRKPRHNNIERLDRYLPSDRYILTTDSRGTNAFVRRQVETSRLVIVSLTPTTEPCLCNVVLNLPNRGWAHARRNDLIAEISGELLVVEAKRNSNIISLAERFRQKEKRVSAFPGASGCDALIAGGAKRVGGTLTTSPLIDFLKVRDRTLNQLIRHFGVTVLARLVEMELDNLVVRNNDLVSLGE